MLSKLKLRNIEVLLWKSIYYHNSLFDTYINYDMRIDIQAIVYYKLKVKIEEYFEGSFLNARMYIRF